MSKCEAIGARIRLGERISREEAYKLYRTGDLLELGQLANFCRQHKVPGQTATFLIDRNINYTNVCNTDCSFCAFYRPSSDHPESYVLSKDVLRQKITEALALGATRILLQGGHNDALPYSYYVDLISWMTSEFPIEVNAFSPSEIQQMNKISGKSYLDILSELQEVGLKGLPGGGGEILDDDIRAKISPKKTKADQWIEIMGIAQSIGLTTTATMVIGFGETIEQRLNHLERLRSLQDKSVAKGLAGFNCFISWIAQFNENNSMGRSRHAPSLGASVSEYLRNMAISRIYLDNIPHHQSSWPTLGAEISQIGLNFGCDDIGSTMMEENVVSKAGAPTREKWSMSPEELRQHIVAAGFTPAQRDSSFQILKVF